MRTLLILLLLAAPADANYSLLNEASALSPLQRCYRRCEKNHPPMPSPSPKPTVAPLPCEPIGGTKTFVAGQDRMFCFTAADGPLWLTVESRSHGNASCAYLKGELTSPTGEKAQTEGVQLGAAVFRVPGRYYFWVSPVWLSEAEGCDTYTFTVR